MVSVRHLSCSHLLSVSLGHKLQIYLFSGNRSAYYARARAFSVYLFTAITERSSEKKLTPLIHFIPAIALYVYQIPFFMMNPADKIQYTIAIKSTPDMYSRTKFFLILISGSFYIIKSSLVFYRYEKTIRNEFSDIGKVDPKWVKYSIIQMFLILICILLLDVTQSEFVHQIGTVFALITAIYFVAFMAYYGITRSNVYIPSSHVITDIDASDNKSDSPLTERYKKSELKSDAAAEIEKKLVLCMKNDKPYLKNEITLYEFARIIDVNANHLSQVINERLNASFWDFINKYRVEEFKSRIDDIRNKNETILSLALACGFNSKSSFNTVFKKLTGKTPSDFIHKSGIR